MTAKGKFDIRQEEPGFDDFALESGRINALPPDGVFTVHIELADGTKSEGWFIGHSLESSASPTLKSPAVSETFSDPNPLVAWTTFRSPEFRPFEQRILSLWVSRDNDDRAAWDFWTGEPGDLNAVRIGAHEGAPKTKLPPGDYWLAMTAGEERQFGPFQLERGSRTSGPFHIVR